VMSSTRSSCSLLKRITRLSACRASSQRLLTMAALLSPPPESMKELDVLLSELRHANRAGLTRHMAAERTGFDRDKGTIART
jgi:hypothetical protein